MQVFTDKDCNYYESWRLQMQHLSDEQLVVLVLQGQSEAFAILVERYQKQIFALAYRLGGDYDEARDMAPGGVCPYISGIIPL